MVTVKFVVDGERIIGVVAIAIHGARIELVVLDAVIGGKWAI